MGTNVCIQLSLSSCLLVPVPQNVSPSLNHARYVVSGTCQSTRSLQTLKLSLSVQRNTVTPLCCNEARGFVLYRLQPLLKQLDYIIMSSTHE